MRPVQRRRVPHSGMPLLWSAHLLAVLYAGVGATDSLPRKIQGEGFKLELAAEINENIQWDFDGRVNGVGSVWGIMDIKGTRTLLKYLSPLLDLSVEAFLVLPSNGSLHF